MMEFTVQRLFPLCAHTENEMLLVFSGKVMLLCLFLPLDLFQLTRQN
jgi:hypothetical protein